LAPRIVKQASWERGTDVPPVNHAQDALATRTLNDDYSRPWLFVIVPSPNSETIRSRNSLYAFRFRLALEVQGLRIKGGFIMPKQKPEEFEYLSNNPDYVPDPEIGKFMEEEILRAPKDTEHLAQRLRNNTAASPADAGGDVDAAWEDVNESSSETVAGDNPTPDQANVEENALAVGVSLEDNEELEFEEKIERRDRDRFELDESSKAEGDMI
jgi:hypothetical protein